MKNIRILLMFLSFSMLIINALKAYAFSTESSEKYISVDPEKAIICAVLALVLGGIVYIWRHRSQA